MLKCTYCIYWKMHEKQCKCTMKEVMRKKKESEIGQIYADGKGINKSEKGVRVVNIDVPRREGGQRFLRKGEGGG